MVDRITRTNPTDPLLFSLRQATEGLYEIREELGRGGMAVVYLAKDLRLQRSVAIKVMQPSLLNAEGMTDRFLQEARIAAHLQHPNIIIVHDVRQYDDLMYFVMNLVEGASVDEVMRSTRLTFDQIRWLLSQAARGLAHAHSEGVVHRDVKPGNLLVNLKGDLIVTDFGIAKATGGVRMTQTGMSIGTPVYMSPEQVVGSSGLTAASDQYSLGIAAYEMIAGSPPFGGTAFELQMAHVQREPDALASHRPDCPPDLNDIVHRMLSKNPENRWPSLDDLSGLIAAALPFGGGETRKQLSVIARSIHERRRLTQTAVGLRTPGGPSPSPASPSPPSPSPAPSLARERISSSVMSLVLFPPTKDLQPQSRFRLHSQAIVNGKDSGEHPSTWNSSDTNVAVVTDEGEVIALSAGFCDIVATNQFGEARAAIRVTDTPAEFETPIVEVNTPSATTTAEPPASAVSTTAPAEAGMPTPLPMPTLTPIPALDVRRVQVRVTPDRVTLEGGDALPLSVNVHDADGGTITDPQVTWHSDAPTIALVDDRGTLAALKEGTATITATVDGSFAFVRVTVTTSLKTLLFPDAPHVIAPESAPVAAVAVATRAKSEPSRATSRSPLRRAFVGGGAVLVIAVAAWLAARNRAPSPPAETSASAASVSEPITSTAPGAAPSTTNNRGPTTAAPSASATTLAKVAATNAPVAAPPKTASAASASARATVQTPPAPVAAASVPRASEGPSASRPATPGAPSASRDTVIAAPVIAAPTPKPMAQAAVTAAPYAAEVVSAPSRVAESSGGSDASLASATRDLESQLQKKSVVVGSLRSFFNLGSDHVAHVTGAAQLLDASADGPTASVAVTLSRTGPGGTIERRTTRVTFRVQGTGPNASAVPKNASPLQKP